MSKQFVFVSYVQEDSAVARSLGAALRQMGYSTWLYEEDSLAGFSYLEQVHAAIEKCDAFILLATRRSLESHQVRREAETAYEHERLMIPVRFSLSHEELRAAPIFRMVSGTAVSITTDGNDLTRVAARISASLSRAADMRALRQAATPITIPHPESPAASVRIPNVPRTPVHTPRRSDSERRSVGRREALTQLSEAFDSVSKGRGMLVCISGEAGIGKSTFVEEFLGELSLSPETCRIGRGRCSERLAGTEAYLPLLDGLADLISTADGPLAGLLREVAPLWSGQIASTDFQQPSEGGPLHQATTGTQERLKRELAAFLREACRDAPVIFFFDDLQWVDLSTVDMLAYVSRHFEVIPALIIVSYRPEELLDQNHPFLSIKQDLQGRGFCRELQLALLTRANIEEYLALRFPRHRFPSQFINLVHATTEGNPLFIVNVLDHLCNQHIISHADGQWVLSQSIPDVGRDLPQSIRAMIQRKIDTLSAIDRQLLVAASVQGYEFDSAVVAGVLNRDAAEIEEQLGRIDRIHNFVRDLGEQEFPDRTVTVRYRFVHILYQNILFASIAPTRRTLLSRQVGIGLERFYGDRTADIASELAVLYRAAREFSLSAHYFGQAARKAADVFAFEEALALGRRAIDCLRALPETSDGRRRELDILMIMGVSASATRGYSSVQVKEIYDRAQVLCIEFNEVEPLARVLYKLFTFSVVRLHLQDAKEVAARLQNLSDNSQSLTLSLLRDLTTGLIRHHEGDFEPAAETFGRIATDYDIDVRRAMCAGLGFDPTVAANMCVGQSLWCLGYPDKARRSVELALSSADELGHKYTQAYAFHSANIVFSLRGDWEQVERYSQQSLAIATEEGFSYFSATGLCFHGLYLTRHGRLDEGLTHLRDGFQKLRDIDGRISQRRFASDLAKQLALAGRLDEGLDIIGSEMQATGSDRFWESELLRVKGELLVLRGTAADRADGEECLKRAVDVARVQGARSLELRAATSLVGSARAQPSMRQAVSMLSDVYSWFEEGLETADLMEARRVLSGNHE